MERALPAISVVRAAHGRDFPCWSTRGHKRAMPAISIKKWGGRWGSNPRPPESQSGALPTELRPPLFKRTYFTCFHQLRKFLSGRHIQTGAPARTRTWNPRLRRPVLYPVELRAQNLVVLRILMQSLNEPLQGLCSTQPTIKDRRRSNYAQSFALKTLVSPS